MAKFLLIYHGGKTPDTPEEGEAAMAAWGKWYEGMGAATIDPGNPVGQSRTVTPEGIMDDGGANPASGYTIVDFPTHEDACAAAALNPIVLDGTGSVEVAPIFEI